MSDELTRQRSKPQRESQAREEDEHDQTFTGFRFYAQREFGFQLHVRRNFELI